MKTLTFALACLLGTAAPVDKKAPQSAPVFDREKLAQRIEELARHAIEREGVPGMTIAVAEGDDVFFSKGYGYADAQGARPAKGTTRYPIGTLTRQFTAVAILQLVDAEKIMLEDGIEKYLPEFPLGERKVTIQQMLSNTSGIPGFHKWNQPVEAGAKRPEASGEGSQGKDPKKGQMPGVDSQDEEKPGDKDKAGQKPKAQPSAAEEESTRAFFARFKGVPFDFEPGTDFALDSANYALLSIVVSRVAKMPYTQYVTENILEPVGLAETEFCPRTDAPVGFARDCKGAATPDDFELPTAEATNLRTQSLCSSASDLVKWQQALLARAVFSERGSHRIMAPYVLADGNSTNFGTAIQMSKLHDFKNYAYTGLGSGFRARLSYWSLPKVTIVVLANCDSAEVERIERDIARFILSVPLPATEETKLTPEEAALCVGLYQIATTQYRIEWRDGQLWYTPPSQAPTRLCHRGELVFAFESDRDVTVTFHRTEGRCDGYTLYRGGFESKARRMD